MHSVLAKARPGDVVAEPFPHVVIENALDAAVYEHLAATFPPLEVFDPEGKAASNQRVSYMAKELLANPNIASVWQEFARTHTSHAFFQEVVALFRDFIPQVNPTLEKTMGPVETLRTGLRHVDTFADVDLLLDAAAVINTPVRGAPSSVRKAHVDLPRKLFTGLFYLRHPEDTATGGDLELYCFKDGVPYGFRGREIPDRYVERVKTIAYRPNVLVMYLDQLYALHGVTPRSVTNVLRRLCTIVGEFEQDQYDLALYQER